MFEMENDLFILRGDQKYQTYAASLLKSLEYGNFIKSFFHIDTNDKVVVNLSDDIEDIMVSGFKYEEYAENSYNDQEINVLVSEEEFNAPSMFVVAKKVLHAYSHILYARVVSNEDERVLWLDEGLAQYLSGEKSIFLCDKKVAKSAFLSEILNYNKNIPKMDNLLIPGDGDGEFHSKKYSGYMMSYFMVRYLIMKSTYASMYDFVTDKEMLSSVYENLISKTINYFGSYFKVKMSSVQLDKVTNPEELMSFMDTNFSFGWVDKYGSKHTDLQGLSKKYVTRKFDKIKSSHVMTCPEQAQFCKGVFDQLGIENEILCLKKELDSNNIQLHFISVYKENGKWCAFEFVYREHKGISVYDTYDDMIFALQEKYELDDVIVIPEIPEMLDLVELIYYVKKCALTRNVSVDQKVI